MIQKANQRDCSAYNSQINLPSSSSSSNTFVREFILFVIKKFPFNKKKM